MALTGEPGAAGRARAHPRTRCCSPRRRYEESAATVDAGLRDLGVNHAELEQQLQAAYISAAVSRWRDLAPEARRRRHRLLDRIGGSGRCPRALRDRPLRRPGQPPRGESQRSVWRLTEIASAGTGRCSSATRRSTRTCPASPAPSCSSTRSSAISRSVRWHAPARTGSPHLSSATSAPGRYMSAATSPRRSSRRKPHSMRRTIATRRSAHRLRDAGLLPSLAR